MARASIVVVLLTAALFGCGNRHAGDRPFITDCTAAMADGLNGDPCELSGECGLASADGLSRRAAVCDEGILLLSRIDETTQTGVGSCVGARFEEADSNVTFETGSAGCVTVTFCNEILGGGISERVATVCQMGAAAFSNPGTPIDNCERALMVGVDADPCAGWDACFGDRAIAAGVNLPILAWCDRSLSDGILRLAATQTLIHGAP